MHRVRTCVVAAVMVVAAAGSAWAQGDKAALESYKTFYLKNAVVEQDGRDIVNDLRNMLMHSQVYYLSARQAISVRGTDADLEVAERLLADVDKVVPSYRLTYTVTDIENGQRGAEQRYSFVVTGGKSDFKQGRKVPIVTASTGKNGAADTEVQYIDVGLSIEATLDGGPNGLRLHSKIEESKLGDEPKAAGDPVILQRVLEAETGLTVGKSVVVGAFDVPDTGRRAEIAVEAEALP